MASRRAWNEAMKKAATGTGLKLPDHRRSSNRSKRREKARKATVSLTNNDPDGIEYRNALRLDFLEGAMVVDDEEVEEVATTLAASSRQGPCWRVGPVCGEILTHFDAKTS